MLSKKPATYLLFCASVVMILLLSALNIQSYLEPKPVLGIETEDNEKIFWEDFLSKNPNYIPGWIELGRLDKVKQIDPNYPLP
ncbi:MAG: hypothetical protein AAB535_01980 [Patescibacteria group bacterium]